MSTGMGFANFEFMYRFSLLSFQTQYFYLVRVKLIDPIKISVEVKPWYMYNVRREK